MLESVGGEFPYFMLALTLLIINKPHPSVCIICTDLYEKMAATRVYMITSRFNLLLAS